MEETLFFYWLVNIPKIGNKSIAKLLDIAKTPEGVWSLTRKELESPFLGLKPSQINEILDSKIESQIVSNYNTMISKGIQFIPIISSAYPQKLFQIHEPPYALYVKGKLPDPSKLSVAIVGARTCSEYGRYVARKISCSLSDIGIQIISGLARGIDGIAQKNALQNGGYSCAVLGCGVDICYPPENADIYDVMSTNGGIISEYPVGTKPSSKLFPYRNRIISGLSDVVIVIEARERSGSLITADMALDQGKDIYALPGRVTDTLSHGCNRLIKQGAGIILSPEEFIQDLLINYASKINPIHDSVTYDSDIQHQTTLTFLDKALTENDKKILLSLSLDPQSLAVIQSKTNISVSELTHSLLTLSMKGLVHEISGHYVLSKPL